MSRKAIDVQWSGMKKEKRRLAHKQNANIERAKQRMNEGASDIRTLNFVTRKGRRRHKTKRESQLAQERATREYLERKSKSWLDFKEKNANRCSEKGCVIGSTPETTFACFLDFDHVDPSTKVERLAVLKGATREAELPKTVVRCLWHHFLHTRDDRRYAPVSERRGFAAPALGTLKEKRGCQHPLHSTMPYAAMIPSADRDLLVVGFFGVTRLRLVHKSGRTVSYHGNLLNAIEAEEAVIHCNFCHKLYRLCGNAQIHETSTTRQQFLHLKKYHPAFVEHFEKQTAGYNWEAEKKYRQKRISSGRLHKGPSHLTATRDNNGDSDMAESSSASDEEDSTSSSSEDSSSPDESSSDDSSSSSLSENESSSGSESDAESDSG